jgi:hypothetical protein
MRVEAFTEAKDPARPETNEDRFVVLPGRLYAVIDGVTARNPARYEGMSSGQFAADLVRGVLERGTEGDGLAVVRHLSAALAAAQERFGIAEQARADANLRFSSTLALVLDHGARIEIVLVGDSGVRINGAAPHQVSKDLDGITAALRVTTWHHASRLGHDPGECERLSRAVAMQGTRHAEGLSTPALREIEETAAAACARRYPTIAPALIAGLLQGGIVNEQKAHQNNAVSPLGYSCLDGTAIPDGLIGHIALDGADVREIELFTDGYFTPGPAFGVAAWEAGFAAVEREDPAKLGRYASVRGSIGGLWSDDRTYVGVRR